MMKTKLLNGNSGTDTVTATLPREQYQPRKLLRTGSSLTAILEAPTPESPDSTTRNTPKKHGLRRTSTSVSLLSSPRNDGDDDVFISERMSPRRDSGVGSPMDQFRSSTSRRASFRTIGSRVTGLIRAKNAFRRFKKTEPGDKEEVNEEVYVIKEMPKYPRFASTLSAEAQYAIMMGYEDIVYNRLTVSYPEYRQVLRRNKTPSSGVEVTPELPIKTKPVSVKDNKTGAPETQEQTEQPKGKGKKSRHKSSWLTSTSTSNINVKPPTFSRSKSLPYLVSADKQLVMTHRYQKAMDIYDSLRKRDGVNVLSPRIKGQNSNNPPIKEFNSWSVVWSKEFKTKSRTCSA